VALLILAVVGTAVAGGVAYFVTSQAVKNALSPSPPAWVPFSPPGGRYTVLMPGTPAPANVTTNGVTVTRHILTLEKGQVVYGVSYIDFPAGRLTPEVMRQAEEAERNGLVAGMRGTAAGSRAVTVADRPGREVQIRARDSVVAIERLCQVRLGTTDRLFILAAQGPNFAPDGGDAARFFSSFTILDAPAGPAAPDPVGPGAPGPVGPPQRPPDSPVTGPTAPEEFANIKKPHQGDVLAVRFAPDGHLFTAGRDRALKRWDLTTGNSVVDASLPGPVTAIAGTADGARIAVVCSPSIFVFDGATMQRQTSFKIVAQSRNDAMVQCLAYSPDGSTLAIGCTDGLGGAGEVHLWDMKAGRERIVLPASKNGIRSLAFSPDGKTVAATADEFIKLWDAGAPGQPRLLSGHSAEVLAVAFSPDGKSLASGGADRSIRLWDVKAGQNTDVLEGHQDRVVNLAYTPDSRYLASSGFDRAVRLWEVATGAQRAVLEPTLFNGAIGSVAFNADGTRLAATLPEGAVKVWDTAKALTRPSGEAARVIAPATPEELGTLDGQAMEKHVLLFAPDGTSLAVSSNGVLRLWPVPKLAAPTTRPGHATAISALAYSHDRKTLAAAAGAFVYLRDASSGKLRRTFRLAHSVWKEGTEIQAVAFAPDDSMLALGVGLNNNQHPGEIHLWDLKADRETAFCTAHPQRVVSLGYLPDGKTLVSAGGKVVKLWDVNPLKERQVLTGHVGTVEGLALAPDGKTFATVGDDQLVFVWDADKGVPRAVLEGHAHLIRGVAYSPDGRLLATAGGDGFRLWDTATGEPRATIPQVFDGRAATTVALTGKILAAVLPDGKVKLWDVDKLRPGPAAPAPDLKAALYAPEQTAAVKQASGPFAFSPDGKTLATGGAPLRLWELPDLKPRATLPAQTGVAALTLDKEGKRLAVASAGGGVALRDGATGKLQSIFRALHTAVGEANQIKALAFSPDGKTLAIGMTSLQAGPQGEVHLWDLAAGKDGVVVKVGGDVAALAWLRDGSVLAVAGGYDILLYNPADGTKTGALTGHAAPARGLAVAADGLTLASSSVDRTVRVWDVKAAKTRLLLEGHGRPEGFLGFALAMSQDGKRLAAGFPDATVRLWDLESGKEAIPTPIRTPALAFSPDGKTLASAEPGGVVLWSVDKLLASPPPRPEPKRDYAGQPVAPEEVAVLKPEAEAWAIWFAADGHILITPFRNRLVLWDYPALTRRAVLGDEDPGLGFLAQTRDGRRIVSGAGRVLYMHDVVSRKLEAVFRSQYRANELGATAFDGCALSPDGSALAIVVSAWPPTDKDRDYELHVWDVATGTETRVIARKGRVRALAYSADGRVLAVGEDDGIRLWDSTEWKERRWLGVKALPLRLAFSPDVKLLAAGCLDNTVKCWDVETGKEVKSLTEFKTGIQDVRYSPDGKLLAVAVQDGTVRLWQVETWVGRTVQPSRPGPPTGGLAFSPDGKTLATLQGNGGVKFWDVAKLLAKPADK
jgi:WD40 repeat protein